MSHFKKKRENHLKISPNVSIFHICKNCLCGGSQPAVHNVPKEINILDILQVFVTLQNEKLHCHQPIIVSMLLQNRQSTTMVENAEKSVI